MFSKRASSKVAAALVAALLLATMGLVGCDEVEEAVEPDVSERETVKVGVHTSLTGGLADYGFAAREGIKLAADDFSGFEVDGVEYDIELVILDDKGEPAEAPVVAQNLVDQGVVGVIGALTSGNTNAALPIYEDAVTPLISGSATLPDITEEGFDVFFRTCLRDDLQGAALGEWVLELGFEKAVVMDDRGDYAVGLGNEVQDTLEAGGVEVLREEGQEGDTDFSAQVANMRAFDPDVVIFTGYHREAGLVRKQMVEAGMADVQFMGGDGIKSDEIVGEAGGVENADGMLSTFSGFSPEEMPGYAEFAERFKEATDRDSGPYAENNYDALGALVTAIVEAQSFDGADIIAALHEIEYQGVMGNFGFNEIGDIEAPGQVGTEMIPRFELKGDTWEYIG